MKTLHILFTVAFLVFQVHANPKPPSEDEVDVKEAVVSHAYKDDPGLKKEPQDSSRITVVLCASMNRGYCLPRDFQCDTGMVFLDEENNCPYPDILKCCVR